MTKIRIKASGHGGVNEAVATAGVVFRQISPEWYSPKQRVDGA